MQRKCLVFQIGAIISKLPFRKSHNWHTLCSPLLSNPHWFTYFQVSAICPLGSSDNTGICISFWNSYFQPSSPSKTSVGVHSFRISHNDWTDLWSMPWPYLPTQFPNHDRSVDCPRCAEEHPSLFRFLSLWPWGDPVVLKGGRTNLVQCSLQTSNRNWGLVKLRMEAIFSEFSRSNFLSPSPPSFPRSPPPKCPRNWCHEANRPISIF